MMEKVMRVAVRIRPLLPAELRQNREVCAQVSADSRQVILGGGHVFPCDHAFGSTASQEHVYSDSVKPLLASFFAGKDVTILAYGQSGSGKTYTLSGGHTDRGVIWRFCEDLFLQLTSKDHSHLRLSVCCVSLCGDDMKDLLRPEAQQFRIIDDLNGRTVVEGAAEFPLDSVEDLYNVLECMDDSSSHTLLWLRLRHHSNDSLQDGLLSTLLVVDLAGWKCVSGLVNTDTRRFERSLQISTELRTLADTIRQDQLALGVPASRAQTPQALPSCTHTPYTPLPQSEVSDSPRGRRHTAQSTVHSVSEYAHTHSPLMRLLQNSLSGSAQTLLMVCVSPAQASLTDTVSCLMLAARAQKKYSHLDRRGMLRTRTPTQSAPCTHATLAQHAAAVLEELKESNLSPTLQYKLNSWLDAYEKVSSPSHASDVTLCEPGYGHQLSTDTAVCDETDAAPPQDTQAYVPSLQELKLHCRLQSELLVEQKLLADWLKRDRRASDSSGQRSPLTDQRPAHQNRQPPRCGSAGNRKVYSSPCGLSLERLSATIKTSNQLLLAQLEEQEQVQRLPSARRDSDTDTEAEGKDQSEKRDKKRPVLNRTWTRKHAPDLRTDSPDTQGTPEDDGEPSASKSRSVLVSELLLEKELLQNRKDDLTSRLSDGSTHSEQDDSALHQLDESIEAMDVVIGLRQHHGQQRAPESKPSVSSAPIDELRILEDLSLQEAKALFYTYFSKAVCLRVSGASQQRRVCELEELVNAEREQNAQKLQQLEKEVFFYRSSSRDLRRRLKELVQDAPSPPSSSASCRRGSGDGGHGLGGPPTG